MSTDDQTSENQRPDVERLARTRGLEVVATYEETASGAKKNRAQLAALLRDAHRGALDVVIVWALDRLGRNMYETIDAVRKLDRAGVEIVSVRETWLDTGGPARALLLVVFAWFAEHERDRLIERTIAGMERAKRAGVHIGRPEKPIPLALARALRAEGLTGREVARRLKVPPATMRRAFKRDDATRSPTPLIHGE